MHSLVDSDRDNKGAKRRQPQCGRNIVVSASGIEDNANRETYLRVCGKRKIGLRGHIFGATGEWGTGDHHCDVAKRHTKAI